MSGRTPDDNNLEGEASAPPLPTSIHVDHFEFTVTRIGEWIDCGSTSEMVYPADSELPDIMLSTTPIKRQGWVYPLSPIEFEESKGRELWQEVRRLAYAQRFFELATNELKNIEEPWRSNLHSFLVNIYGYSKAVPVERRDIPLDLIIEKSLTLGPSYAEYVNGLKSFLFAKKCNRRLFSDELETIYADRFPSPKFTCVGDIFRSNQLFYWQPPRPDIVGITSVVPEVEENVLNEFRQACRQYLNEKTELLFFKPNNDYKSLYKDNTKSTIDGKNWQLPPVVPAVTRGESRVAFIPRELSESRAAVVETQASVLRIRWIDSEVRRILRTEKSVKMETRTDVLRHQLLDALKERTRFNHIVRRREKSERWAYCRDFKKEGLTKNRTLLRIMLEELHRRFPSSDAFSTYWFFDEWSFILDGKKYKAERGHGLGMANALTSLMQVIIEKMTLAKLVGGTGKIASFYNNDDAAIIFDSEANAIRYSEMDRNVCDCLGLEFKAKSTYIAHQHLNFCEQYIGLDDSINNKVAYSYDTLFLLWKGINASHARSLAMSMNLSGVPRGLAEQAVEYWGPVLYKNEYRRPKSLGGWFRQIENGVDVSFINVNAALQVPQMEDAANWAYSHTKVEYYPWLRFPQRETKIAQSYPKEWLLSADVDLYLRREQTFKAEADVKENIRAWNAFEKKLKQNFSEACRWWAKRPSQRRDYRAIYREECDNRPKEDIIPPFLERTEVTSFEASYTVDVEFEHPYRATDRTIDLQIWRAGLNQQSYPRKMGITGKIHIGAKSVPKMKPGSAQRAISLRHIRGETKVPLKIWNLYLVPNQDTFKFWHNPFAIGAVADAWTRNYNSFIPKYISPKKQELLDLRTEFYGRELTWKEWMTVGTLDPADLIMISLLKESIRGRTEFEEIDFNLNIFIREFRKYPGFGNFLDSLENFNPETIIEGFHKWVLANEYIIASKRSKGEEDDVIKNYYAEIEKLWDGDDFAQEIPEIRDYYDARSLDPDIFEKYEAGEQVEEIGNPDSSINDMFADILSADTNFCLLGPLDPEEGEVPIEVYETSTEEFVPEW